MSSRSDQTKKIIFIVPYPFGIVPGQRFRYEQYIELLRAQGFRVTIKSFYNYYTNSILYTPGKTVQKVWGILAGYIKRILSLPEILTADYIFLYREAIPVGPPIFEWIAAKVFRKKIIYDFDDAIWLTDNLSESYLQKAIRWRSKVASICTWSYKVSCGNEYLCSFARQFAKHVVLNPTTIDTEALHNPALYKKEHDDLLTIGWTGTHSTLKYLEFLQPIIQKLEDKYPGTFRFLVIANKKPAIKLESLEFLLWKKETEIPDLLKLDIGVMPLTDDIWAKGKCGFKALQYMALEVPAIVSPVGVNTKIIEHGETGFFASTPDEWMNSLEQLIANKALREKMGKQSRKKVEAEFSVNSNASNFLSLFD
jgi:glycosyltransferase involved in cell wall biosynthesis